VEEADVQTQTFDASAGFHLANGGTDRNVILAEEICTLEKQRIRATNEPAVVRLRVLLDALLRERRALQAMLGEAMRASIAQAPWPVWQTIMAVIFVLAGFGFTRMSFEPFDLDPELLWLCSIGISFLLAYATADFLEKTDLKVIVLGLSITLFVLSVAGLAMLASVRGDLFALHLQNVPSSGEAGSTSANENALAFYAAAAPKMRAFLILLSLSLELAAGLALHEVRARLKARGMQPSAESRRLEVVEIEIGQTAAQLTFLQNAPEAFEYEFRRNLYIGLLDGAARHARAYRKWPAAIAFLAILAAGSTLRGQPIDLAEALDYSATSKATSYEGVAAHTQNIEAAARIIASLPPGSRIAVSAISDQSFSRPFTLLTGEIPTGPGKLREYDQIVAARSRLGAMLRRVGPSIKPDYQTTDILGYLIAAGLAFRNTPNMRHVLVIHSDMRQSAPPLDIEAAQVVPVTAALATVDRQHLFAELSGVEVFIYGVHAGGKDIAYWQSLRDFWAAYFERCHATLRAFSMMRETPNLAESR
jgi:hypothetical protein